MAFITVAQGDIIRASHLTAVTDVLTGVSGSGQAIALTQLSSASSYALDVRNLETGSSLGLRVRDGNDAVLLTVAKDAIVIGADAASDLLTISCNIQGKVYIGDSACADATIGLIINQSTNDDAALVLKSSTDVAHTMTTLAETDTYGVLAKAQATSGGLAVIGYKSSAGDAGYAIYIAGRLGEAADTTKTTAGIGVIDLQANVQTGTTVTTVGADGNLLSVRNNTTARLLVDAEGHIHSIGATATDMLGNGLWFLNDTTNANMTLGLTLNQAGNDNEILACKSSDIAHGMTNIAETDTYLSIGKLAATAGGALFYGLSTATTAITLAGYGTSDNTTKSTSGVAYINLLASKANGASVQAAGADANLVSISTAGTIRFLFDAEGSGHSDVEWTTYDSHDDIALLNKLDAALTRDPIKTEFGRFLTDYQQELQTAKVVNFYDPEGPRAMVNWTKLAMLSVGAIRQLASRLELAEAKLQALPGPTGA